MRPNLLRICAFACTFYSLNAFALSDQEAAERGVSLSTQPTQSGLHMLINGGLTYGGDTIATAVYTNGSSTNLKGGGLVQFGLGGLYQFAEQPVAVLLSANYHFHSAGGSAGSINFGRMPIEALAYYTGKARYRIGGGIRMVQSPEYSSDVSSATSPVKQVTYENTQGIVAEIGYQLSSQGWLNFRFVSEKYQEKTMTLWNGASSSRAWVSPKDGSHLGVNFSYEF
ncbi:MAG: hypothetical protein PHP57_08750 [Sideroxydans sp.]|nr:hypothetical protein [Sideroxydans sp.]